MLIQVGDSGNNILFGTFAEDNALSGGDGDDFLVAGASSSNALNGDSGRDILVSGENSANTLNGGEGDDALLGGENSVNTLNGEASLLFNSSGGNDILIGGANSTNRLTGDAGVLFNSSGGKDILIGGANSTNTLVGDASQMPSPNPLGTIFSTGGNDTLVGGANSTNTLIGDGVAMFGFSRSGSDTLMGGTGGTNFLIGDGSQAITTSYPRFEIARPLSGNDRLVSGANAADHMWGDFQEGGDDFGRDTFVFSPNNGTDFIYDFGQGRDTIELDGFPLTSFEDLNIQTVDTNNDNTVDSSIIDFSANNSVTVYGVANLTASDFLLLA